MKNVPYKSFGKQILLHWLGVANYATLRVSNLGYDNDSQQLGFCTKLFTDPTSICMTNCKVTVTVKSLMKAMNQHSFTCICFLPWWTLPYSTFCFDFWTFEELPNRDRNDIHQPYSKDYFWKWSIVRILLQQQIWYF